MSAETADSSDWIATFTAELKIHFLSRGRECFYAIVRRDTQRLRNAFNSTCELRTGGPVNLL